MILIEKMTIPFNLFAQKAKVQSPSNCVAISWGGSLPTIHTIS